MNLAIERYLWSVDRRLRRRAAAPRRREIRRELREHLRAAADEVGAREAVARAGDPAEVAREYADVEASWRRRSSSTSTYSGSRTW